MILYHGSNIEVSQADIKHSRINVDFGAGFYLTPYYEQAKRWCERFLVYKQNGIVSKYNLNPQVYKDCSVLKFESYDEHWLDCIINCRNGKTIDTYDIIEGGIANDKIFNTIELFLSGLIDRKEVLKRLRYEEPNWQVCLKNRSVIERYLEFVGSEKV